MKSLIFSAFAVFVTSMVFGFTVTDVSARQRYPWNNIVDVDFNIGEALPTDTFRIEVKASYAGGDQVLEARTFLSEPVVKAGKGRVTWAIEEDYPNLKAEDVKVAVTVMPFTSLTPVYMVIDLSEGADAKSYNVRYTTKEPVHTPKANDVCKTTQMWLRRIKGDGSMFTMGGKDVPSDGNNSFYAKITKDYYIGIFETTQQQWYQINGNWPSYMSNVTWRATRPLDNFCPKLLFNQNKYLWPDDKELASSSLLKKLRDKTGLKTLNLPTDAQWQFAACAGASGTDYYLNPEGSQYERSEIARNLKSAGGGAAAYGDGLCDADKGSACVGTYKPNAFGLYDMIGNVMEDCLDPYVPIASLKAYLIEKGYVFPVENYEGIPRDDAKALNSNKHHITSRGGNFEQTNITLWIRTGSYQNYAGDNPPCARGIRFCVTCE
ncbi:MAG: SUMF1/EgtB/PvdO family nonheme iron enzyme [Kiritimatiellae bacterium]|nr:SUMF1/EgtB/PvdO family nonheme iron enzyme [Kiritimatiellia bacterium]